jgi:hypothetical protein
MCAVLDPSCFFYNTDPYCRPLPIGNLTKATPLDYALGGNATLETGLCTGNSTSRAERHIRRKALQKRALERRDPTNPYNETLGWNQRELPHDEIQPPVPILPDSARHEFDPEQNYVSWSMYSKKVFRKGC